MCACYITWSRGACVYLSWKCKQMHFHVCSCNYQVYILFSCILLYNHVWYVNAILCYKCSVRLQQKHVVIKNYDYSSLKFSVYININPCFLFLSIFPTIRQSCRMVLKYSQNVGFY